MSSRPGFFVFVFFKPGCRLRFLPGRLPREHSADVLGDPQRGGEERGHHHPERDAQLHLHDVRQLGGPVQEAQRAQRSGPPQPGQERAVQKNPPAETIVAAQNQNPRPHRRERHRQVVADYIPLHLLPIQHHLLALLRSLTHCGFVLFFLFVFFKPIFVSVRFWNRRERFDATPLTW